MDYTKYPIHSDMVTPEAVANAKGHHLGRTKWYNNQTIKGRTGTTLIAIGLYIALYKFGTWKIRRNKYLAEKKVKDARYDLFLREIDAWVKNGKKFD